MIKNSEIQASKVVVLANTPGRYFEFERFLIRRGWSVRLQDDLKLFLEDVAKLKPKYVLISVDFDHSKMPQFRKLLKQIYNVSIVDYAEEQTLESRDRLKSIPGSIQLFGQLTGPAFERLLVYLGKQSAPEKIAHKNKELHLRFGITSVLRKNLLFQNGEIRKPVKDTNRVTCFQVRAANFSGHFLVAMGADHVLETNIQDILRMALKELVHSIYDLPEMPEVEIFAMDIPRVDFKKWAGTAAQFITSGLHMGTELALAYFPLEGAILHLEEKNSFVPVEFQHEIPDEVAPCSLFVHLPLNNKYILYVAENKRLDAKQEINLQNFGVSKLYARAEDKLKIWRHRSRKHYHQMIGHFYDATMSA